MRKVTKLMCHLFNIRLEKNQIKKLILVLNALNQVKDLPDSILSSSELKLMIT